jgi:hypothetical protein
METMTNSAWRRLRRWLAMMTGGLVVAASLMWMPMSRLRQQAPLRSTASPAHRSRARAPTWTPPRCA